MQRVPRNKEKQRKVEQEIARRYKALLAEMREKEESRDRLTPDGRDLTQEFPAGCRVTELHGASQRIGTVLEHRQMWGRKGLYPVVRWDVGVTAFSNPDWGLRKIESLLDRLKEAVQTQQPDCQVIQDGSQIYIKTPGGQFRVWNKTLSPEIPSPRYKQLSRIVAEVSDAA